MKTKMNKFFALLLSATLFFTSITISAEASNNTSGLIFNGAREATEEQVNDWSSVSKSDFMEEVNRAEQEVVSRSSGWIYTSRYFFYYKQDTHYTCGPACVRMALRNITGITYSEEAIALGCATSSSEGTYVSDMVAYINEEQDHNYYLAQYNESKENMLSDLYDCIVYYDSCPIIGVKERTTAGWYYNLNAHFVIAYAVYSKMDSFLLTDPWIGYLGDSYSKALVVSVDNLYTAYNSVNIGYMW